MKTSFAALAVLLALGASAAPITKRAAAPKRGASFTDVATVAPLAGSVTWGYNWDHVKNGNLPAGAVYYPMLWGTDPNHLNGWEAAANAAIAAGATHLLGFNEPDIASQSNLSPQAAAAAWKTYMQPFAGKAKLVSPAITNGPPPSMGTGWMDAFLAACTGCTIDAIAMHAYDSATNLPYFKTYIPSVGKRYNKPVWVTEFAGNGAQADEVAFIKDMSSFLDAEPTVEKYAYFSTTGGILVDNNKALTPLGTAYHG